MIRSINLTILLLVLLLATVLRFWDISNNPPGLTWDEVSLGYNAYSISQTFKDEYGNFLPLNLKSFGDYKPALYAYLAIPSVLIFGLNELGVRFPSALFGVLTVLLIYLLVQDLFHRRILSLLSAFALAISPFALQFSRPAFEANVALFLNVFGTYLFLKGLRNSRFFIISAAIFGLSLFTYQASRLFVPLILLSLLVIYRQNIKLDAKSKIAGGFLGVFAFLIIASVLIFGQSSRLAAINFFAYQRAEKQVQQIADEDGLGISSLSFQVLHGEWFAYIRGLAERYMIYFSPKSLSIDGAIEERHKVPDIGPLYYYSVFLIPLGLVYLLKLKRKSLLIFVWLALAPIPAVLSRDLISLLRGLNLVIPFAILEAAGLLLIWDWVKNKRYINYLFLILVLGIFIAHFGIFLDRYFIHAPKEYSKYWLYGYKQAVQKLEGIQKSKNYERIVFSDDLGQPYIYYLFYSKYPPVEFQKQANLEQSGVDVGTVRKIDNIEFRNIYWPSDRGLANSLFVGNIEELPDKDIKGFKEYEILDEINFLNGENVFRLVETK